RLEGESEDRRCVAAGKGIAWCPAKPWHTQGALLKAPDRQVRYSDAPWAIELDSGERCTLRNDHRSFDCGGGTSVARLAQGTKGNFSAVVHRSGAKAAAVVKTVWRPPGAE